MSSLVFQEKKHFQGFVDFISLSLMLHSYSLLLTYIHWFPDYCRTTVVSSKLKTKAPGTSLLHPYMKNILQLVSPSNCTTLDNQGCIARSFTLETSSSPESYAAKCTMEWYSAWKTQFPGGFFSKTEYLLNEVFLGLIKVGKIHLRSVWDLLALTNRKTMNAVIQRSRVTNLQTSSTCDPQTKSHWKLHLPLWSFVIWPPFLLLLMCQLLLLSSSHPNPANKNALLL
jgi:hypothetical protein